MSLLFIVYLGSLLVVTSITTILPGVQTNNNTFKHHIIDSPQKKQMGAQHGNIHDVKRQWPEKSTFFISKVIKSQDLDALPTCVTAQNKHLCWANYITTPF